MSRVKKNKAEKKNRPHFNAIDAMIIILVIAAIVGVYFRYTIIDFLTSDRNIDDYVVSFSIENIRYTTPNYMSVGDKVYFSADGELFGELTSESENNKEPLNITLASKDFTDSNGNIVEVFYPEETRVNAKGRLLCRGNYSEDGGFAVDGRHYIAAGQSVEVYTEKITVTLKITAIETYEG